MTNINTVKIGVDTYKILKDTEMGGTHLGSINQSHGLIRMREIGFDNVPIPKRLYYKVLMHEIVHGIDFNVFFVDDDKEENLTSSENSVDLVTIYILTNLKKIIEKKESIYDDFFEYIKACESKIIRIPLLFYGILDFIEDNPILINEFLEVYS